MNKYRMMRKYISIVFFLLLALSLSSFLMITAYLTDSDEIGGMFEIGLVKADVEAYFGYYQNGNYQEKRDALDYLSEITGGGFFAKLGVIGINVHNRDDIHFFENLLVDIRVYSSINTYIRIAPYEQMTLKYEISGQMREVAITQKEYSKFNYLFYDAVDNPEGLFYDNRAIDGFIYYMEPVKRIDENTQTVLTLIDTYFVDQSFWLYDSRYSLQIGFIIESVQAYMGPQTNWHLEKTPWNTDWEGDLT